jgi:hypothetical protein
VSQTERLAVYTDKGRLDKPDHPELFKIAVCPHIMVPLEKVHLDPCVHQVRQGGEHLHIAFRHHITILVPEIPYISEKIQCLRFSSRYGTEETHESRLTVPRISDIQAEMYIGDEKRESPILHKYRQIKRK